MIAATQPDDTHDHAAGGYDVFVSYSSHDKAGGRWLRRALRRFSLPMQLDDVAARGSPVKPLQRIFLDEENIAASLDLALELKEALRASNCLVVVCSPQAAHSRWVDKEIREFREPHPDRPILGFIVAGEPGISKLGETARDECFPPSLRFRDHDRGDVSSIRRVDLPAVSMAGFSRSWPFSLAEN